MIVFSTTAEEFRWHRTLLAGHPGAGLTRAAASWPTPLYVRFRPGLPELADRDLSFTVVQNVDDLLDVLSSLDGYETLVIDTLGDLEHLVGADVEKVRAIMLALAALPVHVVFLCRLTHKDGRQFPLSCLNGALLDFVDVALVVEDGFLQAYPDDRLPWVFDRSGRLPHEIPLTFTDEYSRLAAVLGQDLSAASAPTAARVVAPPPAAPATAPTPPPAPEPAAAAPVPPPVPRAPAPQAAEPDPEPDPEEGDPDLPMCESQGRLGNECLGRVESKYAEDLSRIRHRKPMCTPCNEAEYAAMPKKIAAPAKAAAPRGPAPTGTPPPRQPRDEDVAVVPHGEVIGQVPPASDPDLRAFLHS